MPLNVGSPLGHYDVTALIGEGGMGQVYQATDTKLGRQVALKILPEAFATDPDRLARFQREAQVLASLNHPNIAAIHGLEESEGVRALVLELVEGPTLADRIAKGPIPVDEALPIAKQIAEALEAAHEAGVIHRDLKPANIQVRDDGMVKVLDFGLAKALDTTAQGDPSESPTLTAAATQMGVILGTAAYMSPEQARGKTVDKPDTAPLGTVGLEQNVAISPDGAHVLYTGPIPGESVQQLILRPIDQIDGAPLRGGEDGASPFFSPDGQWVGFHDIIDRRVLKKISIRGGPPQTLTESPSNIVGGTWRTRPAPIRWTTTARPTAADCALQQPIRVQRQFTFGGLQERRA